MQLMDYIRNMRSFIGHRPLLLCGASVIIFDNDEKVLMLKRSDNGCWCFPGGALELGEKIEEAAAREALEETGITVGALTIFGVFSGPELHHTYPNGDEVYIVDIVFTCRHFTGIASCNSHETTEIGFFDLAHLPNKISPPVQPVVEELIRRSKNELSTRNSI